MKHIIRLFVLIAALVLGADYAWASAPSNPRVKFVYESEHGFAFASDADANRLVTITVTPDGDYRCIAGDLTAEESVNSNKAEAPRRSPGVGQSVAVNFERTNVFTLTLPEDESMNVTVYVSFSEKETFTPTVSIEGWTYGEDAQDPTLGDSNESRGDVTYTYADTESGTYSITVPTLAGFHWVKATVAATADYCEAVSAPVEFKIEKKTIRIDEGSVSVEDKMYNGTTNCTLYGSFTFEDGMIVESDDVSIDASGVSATFADKNVGKDKVVTVTGLALGGADIDNYILENSEFTLTGNITKQELTVSAMDHTIYYGDAPANNGVEYYGFENGEDESVLGGDLDYDYTYTKGDPVGDYYITPKGLTSNNYVILFAKGMLTVEKKMLTFDGSNVSGIEKEYDGTDDVDNLDEIDIRPQGIYNNDDVKVVVVSGSYASKDVGNNIEVTIYEVKLSGNKKDNYDIDNNPSVKTSGRIIQRNVKITGISVTPKVYDGENWADVNYNSAEFDRLVDGDDVKLYPLNVDATYESVNVGTGIKVSLSFGDATLTGSDEGNYTLDRDECVGETTGDIEKASLIVTAKDHSIDYGDKPANNGVDYDGFVDGEDENNNDLSGTLGFEYTYNQYGPVGTYQITPKGLSSDNYAITFNPGTLTVNQVATISVDWEDNNNVDGLRPASLEFKLLANGSETGLTVTLNEGNDWRETVNGLTAYNGETLIPYTWSLETPPEYVNNYESNDNQSTSNTGATATFTLTRKTGSLTVSNTLVSDLAADADVEFTYNVTLDDTTIDGEYGGMTFENGVATVTLKGGESATATGLMYGTTYTVTQTEVEGFTTSPKVEELLIATGTISTSSTQATFTNTRQMFTITFKNWDGTELSSATYTYGTAAADIEQPDPLPTKAANAEYTYTFKGWTPEIVQVTGDATYTATYNEIVEKTQVSVEAIWDDNNNAEGFQPDNITVKLMANGEEVGTTTLNADNEWNYTFTGLNKYADGQEIEYTLRQDQLAYYKTPVIEKVSETEWEYTVTNSRDLEVTEATVKVEWVDADDELGKRPESVTATLLANGTATENKVTMNAENNWTATAEQLNKYKNGTGIDYTWTLAALNNADYELATPSTEGTTTTFTYNYYPAVTVTITGNNNETTYDGTEHVVNGYEVTDISYSLYTDAFFTFNGEASASQTNAGTAYMGLDASQFTNTNQNYDGKVVFVIAADGYQTITPAPVTVKADDKSKVWGTADDPTLTATVTGMVNDENASTLIAYTIDRATGTITDGVENSGEYTITPAGDATQGNYTVTYETGTFTIEGKPVTIKDAEGHDVSSVENAYTVTQDQDGVTLTLVVPVTLDETPTPPTVEIPVAVEVDHVEIERTFIANRASTVFLPFPIKAGNVSGGKFHTFTNVDETTTPWTVEYTEVTGDIEANTPYIFIPDGSNGGKIVVNNGKDKVTVCTANQQSTENDQWDFIGTYKRIMWTHNTSDPEYTAAREAEIGSIYGFAAEEKSGATIGQFVKVTDNVWIDPMRAYLKNLSAVAARSMNGDAPTTELPDAMKVVIVDGNGETTSLTPALPTSLGLEGSGYYTLDGRKLDKKPTAKGIYIHNGRKEVIK